jgi:hypothetical protein
MTNSGEQVGRHPTIDKCPKQHTFRFQHHTEIGPGRLLPVVRWPITFLVGGAFADEFTLFGAAEIPLALKMVDVGSGVDPNDLVACACHTWRRHVARRLSEGRRPNHHGSAYAGHQNC